MNTSKREFVVKWWNEAFVEGLWAASWGKSLEGLTAEQAAWRPRSLAGETPPRDTHSIQQIVLHMVFWRESWLRRVATGVKPSKEELAVGNFPVITEVSEASWAEARRRFEETQGRMAAALGDAGLSEENSRILAYFLPHDCYHFGQINYLRGMLGLKAIE